MEEQAQNEPTSILQCIVMHDLCMSLLFLVGKLGKFGEVGVVGRGNTQIRFLIPLGL